MNKLYYIILCNNSAFCVADTYEEAIDLLQALVSVNELMACEDTYQIIKVLHKG